MAGILVSMVVIVLATLLWSRQEVSDLESQIEISSAYNQTAMNASLSSIYSQRYGQSGDPQDLARLQTALVATLQSENRIKQIGTDEDRAYLANLESQYAADLLKASQTLTAISAGNFDPGAVGDSGALTEITQALTDRADVQRQTALANLHSVRSRTESLSAGSILVLMLGMPLVVGAYVMTRRYEHKETVRETELERLKEAALTDGLTGLANHRAFQEDLRREVARSARQTRPITIAMLDVDDFKEVNDTEGHAKGDAMLAQLAGLMVHLRGQDRPYRVGGDEFALIMPETDETEAAAALERLRALIEASLPKATMSIGFASTHLAVSPETLRDHADLALYESKRHGKNQVTAFTEGMIQGIEMTTSRALALRRVLDSGTIEMWYQPIYHFQTKELLAFEALLRLPTEPEIEGPQEAFKIAEGLGKARELDMLCVAGALRSADDLPDDVKLFINLDPATLASSRFSMQELVDIVAASRFKPQQIVFEVTEQTVVPVDLLKAQIDAIRQEGFGVALDDVGTGNAGLELMRLIKFDYVKIDRSVIIDASEGGQGRAVILAIVAFARETNSFMIAEGVEDASILQGIQLDEPGLREFWVRGVQGFLLGEPRASIESFLDVAHRRKHAA